MAFQVRTVFDKFDPRVLGNDMYPRLKLVIIYFQFYPIDEENWKQEFKATSWSSIFDEFSVLTRLVRPTN